MAFLLRSKRGSVRLPVLRSCSCVLLIYLTSTWALCVDKDARICLPGSRHHTSSSSAAQQLAVVTEQLGYVPSNYVRVSAWSLRGDTPIAIQTYPLNGGSPRRQAKATSGHNEGLSSNGNQISATSIGTPFPTFYWLTCPMLGRAIGHLEGNGYVSKIQSQIRENDVLSRLLLDCHRQYAEMRWNSLSQEHQSVLLANNASSSLVRKREMLQFSGIAGTNITQYQDQHEPSGSGLFVPSIKCLHTHYAHYRSQLQNLQILPPETSQTDDYSVLINSLDAFHSDTLREGPSQPYVLNPVGHLVHLQLCSDFRDLLL